MEVDTVLNVDMLLDPSTGASATILSVEAVGEDQTDQNAINDLAQLEHLAQLEQLLAAQASTSAPQSTATPPRPAGSSFAARDPAIVNYDASSESESEAEYENNNIDNTRSSDSDSEADFQDAPKKKKFKNFFV